MRCIVSNHGSCYFSFCLSLQRNVGILEKIVQSLNSSGGNRASETIEQYEAQNHVLSQLQDKVTTMLRQQPAQNTAVVKLQRDFQRVQLRASQLQEAAAKKISYIQANKANHSAPSSAHRSGLQFGGNGGSQSFDDNILAEHQRLQQMQLQEDRLHEEIMREREEEIRNINKGMLTVNEIYKDLAHIVGQQQEDIDQIETQMEDSRANAESGLQQVEKANEKYGSSQCSIM